MFILDSNSNCSPITPTNYFQWLDVQDNEGHL